MPSASRKAFPGRRTWERKANFFLHILGRSTFTGWISSRHRFAQPRNQSQPFRKKSDLHIPPFMVISERHHRQTERQLKRWGTSRILAYPFGDKYILLVPSSMLYDLLWVIYMCVGTGHMCTSIHFTLTVHFWWRWVADIQEGLVSVQLLQCQFWSQKWYSNRFIVV